MKKTSTVFSIQLHKCQFSQFLRFKDPCLCVPLLHRQRARWGKEMTTSNSYAELRHKSGFKPRPPNFQGVTMSIGIHSYPSIQIHGHISHIRPNVMSLVNKLMVPAGTTILKSVQAVDGRIFCGGYTMGGSLRNIPLPRFRCNFCFLVCAWQPLFTLLLPQMMSLLSHHAFLLAEILLKLWAEIKPSLRKLKGILLLST